MDGLNLASGAPTTIKLNGETLILSPLTVNDFGLIENHLVGMRPNLIRKAAEACVGLEDDDLISMIMEKAMARAEKSSKVSRQEVSEWLDTRDGVAFTLWVMLEKKYPGRFTMEKMNEVLEGMSDGDVADVINKRDQASGLSAPSKNDEGQGPAAVPAPVATEAAVPAVAAMPATAS